MSKILEQKKRSFIGDLIEELVKNSLNLKALCRYKNKQVGQLLINFSKALNIMEKTAKTSKKKRNHTLVLSPTQ